MDLVHTRQITRLALLTRADVDWSAACDICVRLLEHLRLRCPVGAPLTEEGRNPHTRCTQSGLFGKLGKDAQAISSNVGFSVQTSSTLPILRPMLARAHCIEGDLFVGHQPHEQPLHCHRRMPLPPRVFKRRHSGGRSSAAWLALSVTTTGSSNCFQVQPVDCCIPRGLILFSGDRQQRQGTVDSASVGSGELSRPSRESGTITGKQAESSFR